jgi:hypothetical protein
VAVTPLAQLAVAEVSQWLASPQIPTDRLDREYKTRRIPSLIIVRKPINAVVAIWLSSDGYVVKQQWEDLFSLDEAVSWSGSVGQDGEPGDHLGHVRGHDIHLVGRLGEQGRVVIVQRGNALGGGSHEMLPRRRPVGLGIRIRDR